jgi:hypothetical protein
MPRLKRRMRAAVAAGDNCRARDARKRLAPRGRNDVAENVLALSAGRRGKLQPSGRFAVTRDQPAERARGRLGLRRRSLAADCGLIFGLEFRRAELGAKADARPLAYADIPVRPWRDVSRCKWSGRGRGIASIKGQFPSRVQEWSRRLWTTRFG